MAYRNKTIISFASEDIKFYRLMTAWNSNEKIEFNFHDAHDLNTALDTSTPETIKRRLRERLVNTKQVLLLIGDETKAKASNKKSFIHYEVEVIKSLGIPVILINLNKNRKVEMSKIPTALQNSLYTISVPFQAKAVKYALDNFPDKFYNNLKLNKTKQKIGPYNYKDSVYKELNI